MCFGHVERLCDKSASTHIISNIIILFFFFFSPLKGEKKKKENKCECIYGHRLRAGLIMCYICGIFYENT